MQKEKNFMLIVGISEGRRKEIENKQENRASNGDHQHNKNNNITDTPELNNCLVYSRIFVQKSYYSLFHLLKQTSPIFRCISIHVCAYS